MCVLPGHLVTTLQKDPQLSFQSLNDLVGLFKWVMQTRIGKANKTHHHYHQNRKRGFSRGVAKTVFSLGPDGVLVCMMLAVFLLFVPSKELRPSLFISFK